MAKFKIIAKVLITGILAGTVGWGILQQWPRAAWPGSGPKIYRLQFGVTVNKFMVIGNRLHLIVPLPVTGESGKVIEIDKISKKARRGK